MSQPPTKKYPVWSNKLERIRISFFENPLFCPSLQGETMGREGLMRGHKRVDLGARTWYRPCAMATTRQRVDKDTFKQIFRDHWRPFQQGHPRYQDRHVQAVIDKMLGCGTPESGYTTYLCPHCLEEKRVAFSCKSSFCLSCCKVYVDEWVAHIGRTLYEGVAYRHVVLTMPDALHLEFYRDRPLLADLMQCGVAMLSDALSWFTKVKLEAGYVVVLETAGRSGHWNPHLHILMTSGGMTPQKRWREVDYFPFTVLHKKWQYHLFTMLKQRVGTRAIKDQDRRLVAQVSPRPGRLLGRGQGPGGWRGVGVLLGEIRRQSPDLPAAHPELRRAAGAVLVQRSQDQATAGGRGLGADVHRSDGATYSAERVSSHSLLWAACHVQGQEGEGGAHRVDGGAGSADQGDVSHRGAEDLSRARAGQYGA